MFQPEFRNPPGRHDQFQPAQPEVMEMVVDKFMKELNGQLAAKRVKLRYSPAVRTWLAKKGHDPRYGGAAAGRA